MARKSEDRIYERCRVCGRHITRGDNDNWPDWLSRVNISKCRDCYNDEARERESYKKRVKDPGSRPEMQGRHNYPNTVERNVTVAKKRVTPKRGRCTAEKIRQILNLRKRGMSWEKINATLGITCSSDWINKPNPLALRCHQELRQQDVDWYESVIPLATLSQVLTPGVYDMDTLLGRNKSPEPVSKPEPATVNRQEIHVYFHVVFGK